MATFAQTCRNLFLEPNRLIEFALTGVHDSIHHTCNETIGIPPSNQVEITFDFDALASCSYRLPIEADNIVGFMLNPHYGRSITHIKNHFFFFPNTPHIRYRVENYPNLCFGTFGFNSRFTTNIIFPKLPTVPGQDPHFISLQNHRLFVDQILIPALDQTLPIHARF
jgi:hypothetical protein